MGKTLRSAFAWAMAFIPAAYGAGTDTDSPLVMKILLTINGKAISATLINHAAAKDFLSLLPMTLIFEDYAATEKIAYPPRKLSTAGAPPGSDPSAGDIAYYAPWGNLAIFYRDARYAIGLIPLGRIDSDIEALNASGPLKATIEAAEK